ncbi:hypothetical protein CC80DRAFT_63322 [Byssothecium circinans]|uniref:Transcription initiation factor TFIID subunit 1 histone acetyltransferase domain-containing protein n=1 Tax=Byssothecium circinans TaxID=147558 RepID=A0A6A5TYG0_9PLEO|nr:hypothetical protein CC80DRAFT_63322 [Byssothecium circinans]
MVDFDADDLFGDNEVDIGPAAEAASPDVADEELMSKVLTGGQHDGQDFLGDLMSRPLELGEKADDAVDYENIGDDDLPEEEAVETPGDTPGNTSEDSPAEIPIEIQQQSGTTVEGDEDGEVPFNIDDLFIGREEQLHENVPLQSVEAHSQESASGSAPSAGAAAVIAGQTAGVQFRSPNYSATQSQPNDYGATQSQPNDAEEDDEETRLQMALFAQAGNRSGEAILPAPRTSKEVFDQIWPNFEPDKAPRFASLIPRKRAYFVPRVPLKVPKPLAFNNKVNLDIAPDQEKSFRLSAAIAPVKSRQDEEQGGIIPITKATVQDDNSDDEMNLDDLDAANESDRIGNVTLGDLQIACEDWEMDSLETLSNQDEIMTPPDGSIVQRSPKRRRVGDHENPVVVFSAYDHMSLPSWDDPELATARLAKRIMLDMNDPRLLLDVQQPSAERQKPRSTGLGLGLKRDNRGSLANPMFKRFNISNDEAYDALKESSQQKVRGTIGHMSIEHSLPALKLQYPFYKVQLNDRELRSFHRPAIQFKAGERATISKLDKVNRKIKRHLKPSEAFAESKDLNVGDNSEVLLAEYSEEYPTTLSNFGMGVKLINYYRRLNNEDTTRPKPPFGETQVLLPQDKSPFATFGEVDPGDECLTLHNAMYRAPVFQHDVQKRDFLVSRSTTGKEGSKYYIRNIDNLVVVGQEFPSVEVPGTHARKVTEASKKRLKMLAFRLYRRGQQHNLKQPWVSNEMIKYHLPGTEIAQNRSRMREIMKYVKETGTWEPVPGETVPDEPTLRSWIKPEDICLIDSMNAGHKQLQDAGIKANEIDDEDAGDGTEAAEIQLAPWNLTKNFLNACTGKAMLEVHGRGDPTGVHEGLSFLKISMKGGFRDIGESYNDIKDQNQKENGGHSYNVAKQMDKYQGAIRRVWDRQKSSLSSKHIPDEPDRDVDTTMRESGRGRSAAATPAFTREDETMSQYSRNSANESRGKKLRITRTFRNAYGEIEEKAVIITDPEVIKLYLKRKRHDRLMNLSIDDIKPTGDAELDRQQMLKLKQEYARLQRNIERREGREKAKGVHRSQTGDGVGTGKGGATPRKCANCGEVGHIKTNKKLCPLLNGQKKQSDTFKDASASSPVTVAPTPLASTPQTAGSPV